MEPQKEVKKFDPNDVIDNVKEHIKRTFVSLIPTDQWDDMIKKVISDYLHCKHNTYDRPSVSSFESDVISVIKEHVTKRAQEIILSEWVNAGDEEIRNNIRKLLVDNSGTIVARCLEEMFKQTLQQLQFIRPNSY